jgi:hypothetical protein
MIVAESPSRTPTQTVVIVNVRIDGPPTADIGPVETRALPGGGVALRLPLPNTLILPFSPPSAVSLPCDLLRTPSISHVLFTDGFERPAYSFFKGVVGGATCGGQTRPSLNLHPPPNGRTLADYWLKLPPQPARLVTAIGIRDGSKSEGVAFDIEVNGRRVFYQALKPGLGWVPVEIDMRPWQGQPVMLTFMTDALGDYSFDWAAWAAPCLIRQEK